MQWFNNLLKNYIFKTQGSFNLNGNIDPFQFQPKAGSYGNNHVSMNNFQISDSSASINNSRFEFIPIFPIIVRLQHSNINLFIWNEV